MRDLILNLGLLHPVFQILYLCQYQLLLEKVKVNFLHSYSFKINHADFDWFNLLKIFPHEMCLVGYKFSFPYIIQIGCNQQINSYLLQGSSGLNAAIEVKFSLKEQGRRYQIAIFILGYFIILVTQVMETKHIGNFICLGSRCVWPFYPPSLLLYNGIGWWNQYHCLQTITL